MPLGIAISGVVVPDRSGHFGHDLCQIGMVGGIDGLALGTAAGIEPVTETANLGNASGGLGGEPLHIALQRGKAFHHNARVSIGPIDMVGAKQRGIAPSRGSATAHDVGNHMGKGSVGHLVILTGGQPAGKERRHVKVIHSGGSKELGVTGPAHPLVTLRAVGRNFQVIALLAPNDVAVKLIQIRR